RSVDDSIEPTSNLSSVTTLADGRIQVTAQLNSLSMTSVTTRATADEDRIYDGWCLVFGEDEANFNYDTNIGSGNYSDSSPLIQIEPVTINANGTFTMVFDEYPHAAFMRIVVNLTDREDKSLENIVSWRKVVNDEVVFDESGNIIDTPSESDTNGFSEDGNEDGIRDALQTPPTNSQVSTFGIATFGQYRYQSVGLDGIYNMTYNTETTIEYLETAYDDVIGESTNWAVVYSNTDSNAVSGTSSVHEQLESYNGNRPDPSNPKTTGFPMSSYGFVLNGITEETLNDYFGSTVYMIRTCSKVQVEVSDNTFKMSEVYLIDAAQESRIRSTVMSVIDNDDTSFSIPVDLGGTITYQALSTSDYASDPIYFYPNSGGDYDYEDGAVDQDINPQYVIIKGQSSHYDTPGYYKVALKAQYPLDESGDTYSDLTYDILRNTSFTVKLLEIDKPGYKTFDDAADVDSPANNISYSITIDTSDNRYEVLVSKGTYYAELETSRVYVKGYMDEGLTGCYVEFSMTPSDGNTVPTVYVQSSDLDDDSTTENVKVTHCLVMRNDDEGYDTDAWSNIATSSQYVELTDNDTDDGLADKLVKIESSDKATKVRVYYDVNDSGRLRLRIGDILKFIPVTYDAAPISYLGTGGASVTVEGTYNTTWDDFSYSEVVYDESHANSVEDFKLNDNGSVTYDNSYKYDIKPELRARIVPQNAGDGNAVLYLRQASDFQIAGFIADGEEGDPTATNIIEYTPQGKIWNATILEGLAGENVVIDDNDIAGTFDGSEKVTINTASVDGLTISQNTVSTTPDQSNYISATRADDGTSVSFYTESFDYDLNSFSSYESANIMRKASTSTTTITLTNAALDKKTYQIYQTHNPPIYLVATEGDEKSFTLRYTWGSSVNRDNTCIYAVGIYNWDGNATDDITWTSMFSAIYGDMTSILYSCVLNEDYIDSYDYTVATTTNGSTTDYTGYLTTAANNNVVTGNGITFNALEEFEGRLGLGNPGDVQFPDAAFILMRTSPDTSYGSASTNSTTQTITVTDNRYGEAETYRVTKDYTVSY
ncbi:MAG: hypothetical protein SNG60_09335, partial [Rikenellaceae bacterium]